MQLDRVIQKKYNVSKSYQVAVTIFFANLGVQKSSKVATLPYLNQILSMDVYVFFRGDVKRKDIKKNQDPSANSLFEFARYIVDIVG